MMQHDSRAGAIKTVVFGDVDLEASAGSGYALAPATSLEDMRGADLVLILSGENVSEPSKLEIVQQAGALRIPVCFDLDSVKRFAAGEPTAGSDEQLQILKGQLDAAATQVQELHTAIYEVTTSREYHHGQTLVRLVDRLAPIDSPQKRLASFLYRVLHRVVRLLPRRKTAVEERVHLASGTNVPDAAGVDVFVFPIIDWNFRYQRPQHLAAGLAASGHRVFYINPRLTPGAQIEIVEMGQRLFEVRLPGEAVDIYGTRMEPGLAEQIVQSLEYLRGEFAIPTAVCLVDLPFWAPVAFKLRQKYGWRVVYDCMDEHTGFAEVTDEMLAAENQLLQESDLVVTTSHLLYESKVGLSRKCVRIPNAGDFNHFYKTPVGIPPEMMGIRHPVIGYYGAIAEWFDTELVADLARQRPGWQFVLIGHTTGADVRVFEGLGNVHLLGEKRYQELPSYLHHFDVCIIPFKRLALTDATNPVKLFEYLSAGKPVISTWLNEISHYSAHVKLITAREDWLPALETALQFTTAEQRQAWVEFARLTTWAERVKELKHQVDALFPKASIIILTYNNLEYTQSCLESILVCTVYPNYEIIIVDNASSDGTPGYLQSLAGANPRVQIILNAENRGFAAGNNQGAAVADGEYLVFLNNDTVVTGGWLSRLVGYLSSEEVGMVGPVTNSSGNNSKIVTSYQDLSGMPDFAKAYFREHNGEQFEIQMLAWMCVAIRKKVFDEIGPLDEQFGMGMFEDDDYAMRIRLAGLKIICVEDVFIHHWGSASFSKLDEAHYRTLLEENKAKFEQKWKTKWSFHQQRDEIRFK